MCVCVCVCVCLLPYLRRRRIPSHRRASGAQGRRARHTRAAEPGSWLSHFHRSGSDTCCTHTHTHTHIHTFTMSSVRTIHPSIHPSIHLSAFARTRFSFLLALSLSLRRIRPRRLLSCRCMSHLVWMESYSHALIRSFNFCLRRIFRES